MEIKTRLDACRTRIRSIRIGRVWDKVKALVGKLYSFSWRTAVLIIALGALGVFYRDIRWTVKRNFTEIHSYDNYLGNHVKVRKFANSTCYTYDYVKDERLSPRLRWVSTMPERDSLTVFCDKKGKRGFLNVNTGLIEIEGQYERAWHFSEGLAAVAGKDNMIGFINHDNEVVIPMEFERVPGNEYIFRNGYCVIQDKETGLWGAIDTTGAWKVRPEYGCFRQLYGTDGYSIVYKGAFEGLLDPSMNFIFEPVYDDISLDAPARTAYLRKGSVKQHVSFEGEVLEPFVIDSTEPLMFAYGQDEEGAILYRQHPSLVSFSIGPDNCGVLDSRTGEVVVPAIYDCVSMISEYLIGADIYHGSEKIIYTTDGIRVNRP